MVRAAFQKSRREKAIAQVQLQALRQAEEVASQRFMDAARRAKFTDRLRFCWKVLFAKRG